jgi:hypothetical protein
MRRVSPEVDIRRQPAVGVTVSRRSKEKKTLEKPTFRMVNDDDDGGKRMGWEDVRCV